MKVYGDFIVIKQNVAGYAMLARVLCIARKVLDSGECFGHCIVRYDLSLRCLSVVLATYVDLYGPLEDTA